MAVYVALLGGCAGSLPASCFGIPVKLPLYAGKETPELPRRAASPIDRELRRKGQSFALLQHVAVIFEIALLLF